MDKKAVNGSGYKSISLPFQISKIQAKYGKWPFWISLASFIASLIAIAIAYKSYTLAEQKQQLEVTEAKANGLIK